MNGTENGDNDNEDNEDDDNSRFSSATDDISRSAIAGGDSIMECLKVPVLKLKVAAYVDGTTVVNNESVDRIPSHSIASSIVNPSNECSSDFDAASESQSMSTTQGRLSSCSELDDQTATEVFVSHI
jgi:hypothetical protein